MTFYCSVVGNYFIQILLNYKHSQREENRRFFSSQSCFHSFSLIYETVLVFFLGAAYQSHLLHHAHIHIIVSFIVDACGCKDTFVALETQSAAEPVIHRIDK